MKNRIQRIISQLLSVLMITVLLLGCIGTKSEAANPSLSSYDFYFTDVKGITHEFNGGDGTASVIVFGGISSCGNTNNALATLDSLLGEIDSSQLTVYAADIKDNSNQDILNEISDYSSHIITASCSSNSELEDFFYDCWSACGIGYSLTMPLIIYKAADGSLQDYTTGSISKSSMQAKIEALGITVNDVNSQKVEMTVTFGQSEMRSELELINSFRTGSEAWYWDELNTEKIYVSGLSPLTYDYNLEKVAMLRAVEIAFSYSHTRPNGESCFSAYDECGYNCRACGENIAFGFTSSEEVFEAWREDDDYYDGQGHRRNMLDSDFTSFAVAHVTYNGVDYWVQEFAAGGDTGSYTEPDDSTRTVSISCEGEQQPNGSGYSGSCPHLYYYVIDPVITYYLMDDYCHSYTITGSCVCADCGEVLESYTESGTEEHTWDTGSITKQPTAAETGIKTYTCFYCGATKAETIAKTGTNTLSVDEQARIDQVHCEFRTREDGKSYWYEYGVRQGTYEDENGVIGDGTVRGREIYDPDTEAWYWLDACYEGAKATSKEVWMPYIYQNEDGWSEDEIWANANASDKGMAEQVHDCIVNGTGKWVRYDSCGRMIKGWYTVTGPDVALYPEQAGNTYYYDHQTGLMAKGWLTIDGETYHFDENTGALIR